MGQLRAAVLLGSAAVLLSGCVTSVAVPRPASRSPATLAVADARQLLSVARLPSGALPVKSALEAFSTIAASSLVDLHRTYSVPRVPSSAWLVPPGGSLFEHGSSDLGVSNVTITFAPTSTLQTRQLQYTFSGRTMRVDAQVVWVPRRPAAARIAQGAARLVIADTVLKQAALVRAPRDVASITGILNSLPMRVRGLTSCPDDTGGMLSVTFFHAGRADPYASVEISLTGCPSAEVTQDRSSGRVTVAGLNPGDASARIASIAGLRLGPS